MIIINEKDRGNTIIENLNVTRNGIYQEANKAYSPVIVEVSEMVLNELSVTENGEYTPSQGTDGFSRVNVNVALPENGYLLKTVKDNVVSFDDGSILPMPSVIADINAVQDLHGYDNPWPAGGGKNLFGNGNQSISAYQNVTLVKPLSAGTYRFGAVVSSTDTDATTCQLGFFDSDNTSIVFVQLNRSTGNNRVNALVNLNKECTNIYFYASNSAGGSAGDTATFDNIQIEAGSSATDYAPYSNVCPISGFNGGDVNVSPTTNAQDGTTYSVSWQSQAGTVYGGNIDLVSGVLTVTHANIASYDGETLPSTWISDRDVYSVGGTPTTGAQVVYELATPLIYQLTPIQVNSLLGINNVWNDTNGETEVKYFGK